MSRIIQRDPRRLALRSAPRVRRQLLAAISTLPRRDRQVLTLLLVERMSVSEAALALGLPEAVVRRGFIATCRKLERISLPPLARTRRLKRAS